MKVRAEDWIGAGFELLREGGADELTIERLCAAVSRTKGSFYHHYADIPAFRAALLAAWERRFTEVPIIAADAAAASGRRRALYTAVGGLDHELELAIRAWAHRDPVARAACDAVDTRRVAYLHGLWRQLGKPKALAARMADLEYAAFLGLLARYGPKHRMHGPTYELLIRALEAVDA